MISSIQPLTGWNKAQGKPHETASLCCPETLNAAIFHLKAEALVGLEAALGVLTARAKEILTDEGS